MSSSATSNGTFVLVPVRGGKTCNICTKQKDRADFYGHPTNPDGLSYKCKECSRTLNRKNYQNKRLAIQRKNKYAYKTDHRGRKTKMLLYAKTYRHKNYDRILLYSRKYSSRNRSFLNAKISAYRKTEEGRFKQRQKQLRRQKSVEGSFTHQEWLDLVERFGKCLMCRTPADQCEMTADHVIPIILGGKNVIENIQPLCRSCNSSKQATILDLRV